MVRVRAAVQGAQQFAVAHDLYQSRGLAWLLQEQYCLGLDFILRALHMKPNSPTNLLLGRSAASVLREEDLMNKCNASLRRLERQRPGRSITEQLRSERRHMPPGVQQISLSSGNSAFEHVLQVMSNAENTVAKLASAEENSAESFRVESFRTSEKTSLEDVQSMVDLAVSRVQGPVDTSRRDGRPVLVLEPKDSIYGRGLYANQRIKKGTVVLRDEAALCVRMNDHVCAHCLSPLPKKGDRLGVACETCNDEKYCSTSCRDAAWNSYHSCMCASINPTLASWQDHTKSQLRGESQASAADSRAALSCLAAAKVFGLSTVAQCHPVELPLIRHLRGFAEFDARSGLSNIGAMAVTMSDAFRQPHLYLEEVLTVLSVLQINEVLDSNGLVLLPVVSLLNHSCTPNCIVAGPTPSQQQVVTISDVRPGEQLFVDYNPQLTNSLSYDERKSLFAQRNFECFCQRCILKK